MKKLFTLTTLAMILTMPLAIADEQHHEGKGEKSHEMGMQERMMNEDGMMDHDAMQERMQTMRETMQEIRRRIGILKQVPDGLKALAGGVWSEKWGVDGRRDGF